MLLSTRSTLDPHGAGAATAALPDGLLAQLRATASPPARPVEVARARALLESSAWFGAGVAEAIATTLLTGDDVSRTPAYTGPWAACGSVVESRCQSQAKRPT